MLLPVIAVAICLLGVATFQSAQASIISRAPHAAGDDLGALCEDKKVDLFTEEQLDSLVEQSNEDAKSAGCSAEVKSALKNLKRLIDDNRGQICSMNSVAAIETFHSAFLNGTTSANDSETNQEKLPESLKKFFYAYALRVSTICKEHMIFALQNKVGGLLTDEDFQQLSKWTEKGSAVRQFLGAVGNFDDIFLPEDLLGAKFVKDSEPWIKVHYDAHHAISKLKSACQRRFKPVYDPLMLPIARLSNLGFNGHVNRRQFKDQQIVDEVAKWPRIVFFCEVMQHVEVVDDETKLEDADLFGVLNKEERARIEELKGQIDAENDVDINKPVVEFHLESPTTVLGNAIFDQSDSQLVKAVKSVREGKTAIENTKHRLRQNYYAMLKSRIKKFHILSVYQSLHNLLVRKIQNGLGLVNEQQDFVDTMKYLIATEVNPKQHRPIEISRTLIKFTISATITSAVMAILIIA